MSERPVGLPEIARVFLKIGAMSYGGPAIMGIMQTEIQERRQWISKADFVEGLALVNMLPGPLVTQLGIFIGHAKAGLAGGVLAGLCFLLPPFLMMLALATAYTAFGTFPAIRHAFHGVGPVVLGLYVVAVYRLGRGILKERSQIAILAGAAGLMLVTPLGLVVTLAAGGCAGIMLFHSWRRGLVALAIVAALFGAYAALHHAASPPGLPAPDRVADVPGAPPGLMQLGAFFFKVGAFIFGGGLSMLAFIQEQVVDQFHWLTPQEFLDGLALGQISPGPVPMLAAFIGFKIAGLAGALVATVAIYLPSFLMMLSILPLLRRMRDLEWLRAFVRGVGPAVIGALAVSLAQMAPHAAPEAFARLVLVLTVAVVLLGKAAPLPLVLGGGALGWLKT